ncbi:MAG: peptidyl-tRNA hydrolase Pth2 [Candidatus Micrarchaeota archaeon]
MYKQAIIIRADLQMGKGKIASQASHASLQAYLKTDEETRDEWENEGMKKITLKVNSENELIEIFNAAKKRKLSTALIRDAGHTQVEPGTITTVGIGPAEEDEIDVITGKLKLL